MSDFFSELGTNIRKFRKLRSLSTRELADIICGLGYETNGAQIGAWERGERSVSAEQLYYISMALRCSTTSLLPEYEATYDSNRVLAEYHKLPQDEQDILRYMLMFWGGDTHALIQFCGLYMAMPPADRAEVAAMGVIQYEKSEAKGNIDRSVPPASHDFVESRWLDLYRKKE